MAAQQRPKLAEPKMTDYSALTGALEGQILPPNNVPAVMERPSMPGPATDAAVAIITAQRVAVKRDMDAIWTELRAVSTAAGSIFEYRIPFKNKKTGKTEYATGPTVKLAHELARVWGNCSIKTRVQETPTAFIFTSQFIDYEKGFTYERAFLQRKSQESGMKDKDRQLDLVFQIGQSKSERNCIVNALPTQKDYMLEFARSGVRQRIAANVEGARQHVLRKLAEMDPPVDVDRVARVFGKSIEKMLVPDLAKLYSEINSVDEGMADPDELWPTDEAAAEELAEVNAAEAANSSDSGGSENVSETTRNDSKAQAKPKQSKPKPAEKPAEQAKPDPEPEPEQGDGPEQGEEDEGGELQFD